MKFQCQLCGYLDAKAPRVCPRCSLKAGADPDQHPEIVEAWKKARAAKPMMIVPDIDVPVGEKG